MWTIAVPPLAYSVPSADAARMARHKLSLCQTRHYAKREHLQFATWQYVWSIGCALAVTIVFGYLCLERDIGSS